MHKLHNSSQEEEEWLDALEAGELDDYGRMKTEKDTSMMTARQVIHNRYITFQLAHKKITGMKAC